MRLHDSSSLYTFPDRKVKAYPRFLRFIFFFIDFFHFFVIFFVTFY